MRQFLHNRYEDIFGDNFNKFIDSLEIPMPKYIRVNSLRTSEDDLKNRLEKKGFVLEKRMDNCFLVKKGRPLGATTEYLLGHYIIQDWTSMLSGILLKPKEKVWDMCAAPGVKTTHISELMKNKGVIVATDYDRKRMNSLIFNCMRMGTRNVVAYNKKAEDISHMFDSILLDTPCSGTGMMRKDHTRRHVDKREINKFQRIQKNLVDAAFSNLSSGGTFIYATCSLEPEENECIVEYALEKGLKLKKTDFGEKGFSEILGYKFSDEMKKTSRIFPYESSGFFVAKMVKQ